MAKLVEKLKKEINKHKPKTKNITLKLREDHIEALEIISLATGKTKSEIVEEALEAEGLFDEKNLEYFKSVIEQINNTKQVQGDSDERTNQTHF